MPKKGTKVYYIYIMLKKNLLNKVRYLDWIKLISLTKLINIRRLFYHNKIYLLQSDRLLKLSLKSSISNVNFRITS